MVVCIDVVVCAFDVVVCAFDVVVCAFDVVVCAFDVVVFWWLMAWCCYENDDSRCIFVKKLLGT